MTASEPRSTFPPSGDGTRNDLTDERNTARNDAGTVSVKALLERLDGRPKRNGQRNDAGTTAKTAVPRVFTPFRKVGHLSDEQASAVIAKELERPQWSALDWRAYFDERAGLLEYDGGKTRTEAEELAFYACVRRWLERNPPGYRPDLNCLHCGDMVIKSEATPIVCGDNLQRWVHHACTPDFRLLRTHDATVALSCLGIVDPLAPKTENRGAE